MPPERLALPSLLITTALLAIGGSLATPPRVLEVLVFFALLLALGISSRRIARLLLPGERPLSTAVAAFTVAVALATLPGILLGHCGVLRPSYYLFTLAALTLATAFLPRPAPASSPADTAELPPPPPSFAEQAEAALALAASAALVLGILACAWRLRFAPVGAFGGDDISYHMGAVATWLHHGDLRMIKFSFGDPSTAFYPILGEICSWVLLAPFRDSDVAARWTQLPFALFSFLALGAIARRLGLPRRAAAFAGLFYASIYHVLPVLAYTAGNDHMTAFFTLAALDGALARDIGRVGRAAVTGLALGLLVGTKYIGLFFAATVLAVLLVLLLARPEGRELFTTCPGRRRLLVLAGTLAGVALLAGGYTYLRNAWSLGNPLFPAPLRLFGREILPGWLSATLAYRRTRENFHLDVWPYLTARSDLFGPLFPYTLLPAGLLAPLVALARLRWKPRAERIETAVVLALPAGFFLEFLELMDDHRDVRYWLAGVGLAAVGLAWLTERLGSRAGAAVRSLLLVLLLHQIDKRIELSYWREALLAFVLLALAFSLVRRGERLQTLLPPRARAVALAAGLVGIAGVALASPWLAAKIESYQAQKLRDRPAALALDRATASAGTTVAYLAFNQPYLYSGSRLQNDVQIVPTNWAFDSQYYRWGGDATFPFEPPEFRRWWRTLGAIGAGFVVLRISGEEEPWRGWMLTRPERFQPLYQDGKDEVYRVVR
jgi:hypothetical protein